MAKYLYKEKYCLSVTMIIINFKLPFFLFLYTQLQFNPKKRAPIILHESVSFFFFF